MCMCDVCAEQLMHISNICCLHYLLSTSNFWPSLSQELEVLAPFRVCVAAVGSWHVACGMWRMAVGMRQVISIAFQLKVFV